MTIIYIYIYICIVCEKTCGTTMTMLIMIVTIVTYCTHTHPLIMSNDVTANFVYNSIRVNILVLLRIKTCELPSSLQSFNTTWSKLINPLVKPTGNASDKLHDPQILQSSRSIVVTSCTRENLWYCRVHAVKLQPAINRLHSKKKTVSHSKMPWQLHHIFFFSAV